MIAYIGIGSNLGNRRKYIKDAVQMMGPKVKRVSSIYETEPEGIDEASNFLNAVVEIDTDMAPIDLLDFLEDIERKLGRKEKGKCKSRTIDLDILIYGDKTVDNPRLKIPHPGIVKRKFVLDPLLELWKQQI